MTTFYRNFRLNWAVQSGGANKTPPPVMPASGFNNSSSVGDYSVYVGELDPNVTDSILLSSFEPYKSIINAHVIVDPITKKSKKYGFVRFSDFEESQRAIYEMNGKYILSRPIKLNIGFKKSAPPAVTTASSYVPTYPNYGQGATSGYSYPSTSYSGSNPYPQSSYPQSSYPPTSYPGYGGAPASGGADPYKQPPSYGGGYNYGSDPYAQAPSASSYNYGQPPSYPYQPPAGQTSGGYGAPGAPGYPAANSYSNYPPSSYPSYGAPAAGGQPPATYNAPSTSAAPDSGAFGSMNNLSQALNVDTQGQYPGSYPPQDYDNGKYSRIH